LVFKKAAFKCHHADAISGSEYYRKTAVVDASNPTGGGLIAFPRADPLTDLRVPACCGGKMEEMRKNGWRKLQNLDPPL